MHIKKLLYAYYNVSNYPILNHLYKKTMQLIDQMNFFQQLEYLKYGEYYSYERNADLESLKEIRKIYQNNYKEKIAEYYYLSNLFKGYKETKERLISPVEITWKRLGEKREIKEIDLPFDVLLTEGLPVNKYVYADLVETFANERLIDISAKEVDQKIKVLSNKIVNFRRK